MPDENGVSHCSSCGAAIIWVHSEMHKPMPLDAEPGGQDPRFRKERVELGEDGQEKKVVHYVKDSEMEANTARLYTSHFVSCPDRDEHRKSR
jgi:hypothetical protein